MPREGGGAEGQKRRSQLRCRNREFRKLATLDELSQAFGLECGVRQPIVTRPQSFSYKNSRRTWARGGLRNGLVESGSTQGEGEDLCTPRRVPFPRTVPLFACQKFLFFQFSRRIPSPISVEQSAGDLSKFRILRYVSLSVEENV